MMVAATIARRLDSLGALTRECEGHGPSEPGAATGDAGDFSLQAVHE